MTSSVAEQIRALIRESLPVDAGELSDDAVLGEEGLGLDSVGVVDLLCACEERFSVVLPAEVLLDGDQTPLTVGGLIAHVAARRP